MSLGYDKWTGGFTWDLDDLMSNAYRLYKSKAISEESYELLMDMPTKEKGDMLNDILFGSQEPIAKYVDDIIRNQLYERFKSV